MKNMSKLALVVAAGLVATSAQAVDIEVGESTVLSVYGEVLPRFTIEEGADGNDTDEFTDDGSIIGFEVERSLGNGLMAYAFIEFAYNVFGEDDSIERDASAFGLVGDFGEVAIGDIDNVFEDLITDATDPFENASLDGESLTSEDKMITYYSPDFNGFAYRVQTRVTDETDGEQDDLEFSLMAGIEYSFNNVSLHAAYDNRGSENALDSGFDSEDPVVGVAAIIDLDVVELGARYSMEGNADGNDIDYAGVSAVFGYGNGDLYAAFQNVSPDNGDDQSQFAFGVNFDLADDFYMYAEYGSYDLVTGGDGTDTITEIGLVYEY